MKTLKVILISSIFVCVFSFVTLLANQDTAIAQNGASTNDSTQNLDENSPCGTLPKAFCEAVLGETATNENPAGGFKIIIDFIANILVALFGIIAVLTLIVSGVQISASAGSENVVKSAKENVFKVVTGLVLIISFRAILSLIDTAFQGVETGYLFSTASGNSLANEGIPRLLGNIISITSFFSGIVAVIFIIVGGIRLITSAGSPKAIEGARKTIIYAVAGLVLSISAYGILVFIQSQLTR